MKCLKVFLIVGTPTVLKVYCLIIQKHNGNIVGLNSISQLRIGSVHLLFTKYFYVILIIFIWLKEILLKNGNFIGCTTGGMSFKWVNYGEGFPSAF